MNAHKLSAPAISMFALACTLSPITAFAQQSAAPEEIIVTTRRTSETLQSVPLAIAVLSGSQLAERHITDLNAVAQYTPNFQYKDFLTQFHGNPTLRGMAQNSTTDPITPVGIFLDGVYLQRDFQNNQSLGDFERIEVVKGPQSALYGANTFAGAINYVIRQPTNDFSGNASITGGNGKEIRAEGAVSGPIVNDVLLARVYAGMDNFGGVLKNNAPGVTGPDKYFGKHQRDAVSGDVKFTPNDALTFDAFYEHSDRTEGLAPWYTLSGKYIGQQTNCGPVNSATNRPEIFCGQFATNPSVYLTSAAPNTPAGLFSQVEPDALIKNDVLKIGAEWQINPSLTAHYTFGMTRGGASEDFSFAFNNYNPVGSTAFSQQFEGSTMHYTSHEARLVYDDPNTPYKFEVGYLHSQATDAYFLGLKLVFPAAGAVLPPYVRYSTDPLASPPGTIFLNNLNELFKVDSGFARASYNFADNRATVGAEFRYTHTHINFMDLNYLVSHPGAPNLLAAYNDPIPRFTAEYKLTPTSMLYASAAQGVKAGGFNGYSAGTITLANSQQSYGEEKNWTYELGAKNAFLDNTLFINADVFYIDWYARQETVAPLGVPVITNGAFQTVPNITATGGAATNYGLEFDSQYKPVKPLTLSLSFGLQNPKYKSGAVNYGWLGYCTTQCSPDGSIGGHQLERTSKYTGTFGAEYRDHLSGEYDYFVAGEVTYQSKQFEEAENLSWIAPFALINARLGVENDHWTIFLWSKNLTDKRYVDSSFYIQSQQQYSVGLGEGRTYGVTLTSKF